MYSEWMYSDNFIQKIEVLITFSKEETSNNCVIPPQHSSPLSLYARPASFYCILQANSQYMDLF